ncbi:hypothetical protein [Mucilaginibacter sp.]|uniref:hypothetical protein n=1 Tax=Mucilaginibacter sp. TaxID=1882438 RepID=UPI002842B676|nr:hypothetical protein [Mucilaginibacter sp.]MDR3693167.1 hypothetical protein [Mucilaginibacter sp.]
MDIKAEKLSLIKWLIEIEDPSLVYQFIILKNELQQGNLGEWDSLPEIQKEHILTSLAEAEAGLVTPAKEVIQRSREKYGLNH